MADEISLSYNFNCTNGNYADVINGNVQLDQNTQGASAGVIAATTGGVSLPISSISTLGYCVLRNLDEDNSVDVGINSAGFVAFATMKASEVALFRWKVGVTPQVKGTAATCKVQFLILQD